MSSSDPLRRIAGDIHRQQTLTRSLKLARKRQQMMLPRQKPEIPGYSLGTVYRPAKEIGGDFYDVVDLDGGRAGILLGDVSGHGIEAALVMGMAKKSLQIFARGQTDPSRVLADANADLCPDLDAETFVTCVYAVLAPEERVLRFARAGHPHPILCNPARKPSVQLLRTNGMILGMDAGGKAFRAAGQPRELALQSGDVILFHTDGVDECRGLAEDDFGLDRIIQKLEQLAPRDGQTIVEQIEAAVVRHARCEALEDDVTLVALRVE